MTKLTDTDLYLLFDVLVKAGQRNADSKRLLIRAGFDRIQVDRVANQWAQEIDPLANS